MERPTPLIFLFVLTENIAKLLKVYVLDNMLSGKTVDELLVIGSFVDSEGNSCKHATTFVRQLCGPEQTPVMLHLDCN